MKSIKAIISFLTIIPSKHYDLAYIAKNIYLFPIAGLLIGFVAVIAFLPFHSIIEALLIIVAIMIVTGGHHTDALADFADGLMVKNSKDVKRRVMHDPTTGSIGVAAIAIYFIGATISLSVLDNLALFITVVVSEVLAKYSMVLLSYLGKPAWEGMGQLFTDLKGSRFIISSIITVALVYLLAGIVGIYALILSAILAIIILAVANRSFGGISGDVFGATNEIVRLANFMLLANFTLIPIFGIL
jgi:adenosylcobinamide-GDP ribazoletransferase